jgi:uncharacterized membrane protein YeiB
MSQQRIAGFDVARSLAIFGMIVVHFMLVMTDGMPSEEWSDSLLQLLDGRPAATFVILAGMGVTLMSNKLTDPSGVPDIRIIGTILRRRGLLLLAFGFLNLTIWQGDILRVYGVSLLIVPWLIWRNSRTLLITGLAFVLAFCLLLALFDYDQNWDWNTMTYHRLWTPVGLLRSLFYDGFRSVLPWTGLLIFGLWLGRLDWSTNDMPRKAMTWGLGMWMATSALSSCLLNWLSGHPQPGLDHESATALFGLQSMPPLPIFLLNAIGCALLVIGASTLIERWWKDGWGVRALAATGRMAFTWYVAHIVIGLGSVIVLGWTRASHLQALGAASGFFAVAVATSLWWRTRFLNGPLEFILRSVG